MKRVLLAGALALAAVGTGLGQEPSARAADPVAERMRALQGFLGEWVGTIRLTLPGERPMESAITVREELYGGGTFHRTHYTMKSGGMPDFEGTSFLTFDAGSGMYKSWTFETGTPDPREESGWLEGSKLVLVSKPHGGMVTRATYTPAGRDSWTMTIEAQDPSQAQAQVEESQKRWTVIGVATLKRKPSV